MTDKSSPKHARRLHRLAAPAPRFALAALSGALIVMFAGSQLTEEARAVALSPDRPAVGLASARPASFSELVARVKPAVVNVAVTKGRGEDERVPAPVPPELKDGTPYSEFFQHFFGREGFRGRGVSPGGQIQAQGSGFIIDPAGYVVTSDHVIADAREITVVLNDGSRYAARVQGRDSKTDLALLKIDAEQPLPYVEFGDSDSARAGDWVVAVGNPFGLGGTVTAGIISARGRDIQSGSYDDFLQIDAPINRGNSGGPLFDTKGQVIGINSSIFSPTGGNVGIGFAVPASLAEPVVAQLKASGRVERGWLGVQIQAVTVDIAEHFGIEANKGALVAGVMPDGPAARAGVRPGDVIIGIGGHPLEDFKQLPIRVAETPIGSDAVLDVKRHGKTHRLEVRIGKMPGGDSEQLATLDSKEKGAPGRLGIYLAELTAEDRQQYGLPEDAQGVLVAAVEKGSPAARAGIRPGNMISMVDQTPVASPEDLVQKVRAASSARRASVLLRVHSGDDPRFVPVKFTA